MQREGDPKNATQLGGKDEYQTEFLQQLTESLKHNAKACPTAQGNWKQCHKTHRWASRAISACPLPGPGVLQLQDQNKRRQNFVTGSWAGQTPPLFGSPTQVRHLAPSTAHSRFLQSGPEASDSAPGRNSLLSYN